MLRASQFARDSLCSTVYLQKGQGSKVPYSYRFLTASAWQWKFFLLSLLPSVVQASNWISISQTMHQPRSLVFEKHKLLLPTQSFVCRKLGPWHGGKRSWWGFGNMGPAGRAYVTEKVSSHSHWVHTALTRCKPGTSVGLWHPQCQVSCLSCVHCC